MITPENIEAIINYRPHLEHSVGPVNLGTIDFNRQAVSLDYEPQTYIRRVVVGDSRLLTDRVTTQPALGLTVDVEGKRGKFPLVYREDVEALPEPLVVKVLDRVEAARSAVRP